MSKSLGILVKLLHEAEAHTVTVELKSGLNVADAHVKDEDDCARPQASPTKRRQIEQDSNMNLFEWSDTMTAVELAGCGGFGEWSTSKDRVPAFSAEKAMSFVENELGEPVSALYADFERQPIAAASLEQVHRAILPTARE